MKLKIIKKDFVLTLEDNARTSLRHGIYHYLRYIERKSNKNDLKFAIIHIFHAIELYLKARLVKESPLLIYSSPERKIDQDAHTVQFEALLGRLRNTGVDLEKHCAVLNNLRKVRNRIEHYQLKSTITEIKDYIAKAARFLNDFLDTELGIQLKDVAGKENYKTLKTLLFSYEERLKKALEEIDGVLPRDADLYRTIHTCPECNNETVIFTDGKPHCYFCSDDIPFTECLRCYEPILGVDCETLCDGCDSYIEAQ